MNKYIKSFVNLSVLAEHSEYYNRDRDSADIELIEYIVRKQIPKKPEIIHDLLVCPRCKNELNCGYAWCSSASGEQLIVRTSKDSDYCPNCGQRIGWTKGETE